MKCSRTLPYYCILVVALVATAVCLWIFSPWDNTSKNVSETAKVEPISKSSEQPRNMTSNITANNREAWESFQFMQCSTGNSSNGEMCCNGLTSNCDLRVNQLLFATMHNAMSTQDNNFIAPNHYLSLEKALDAGFRGFMLDLCDCSDNISNYVPEEVNPFYRIDGNAIDLQFCHGMCFAGKRDIYTVLQNIVNFLNVNVGEVIVIDFQFPNTGTERDIQYLAMLYSIMKSVDGFTDMMYIHDEAESNWPRMRKLVKQNKVSRFYISSKAPRRSQKSTNFIADLSTLLFYVPY